MLRITIHETDDAMAIQLEGRIAGPWVAELGHAWAEAAPRLASRKLSLNLRDVTYVDIGGKQVLRNIYAQTGATLLATSPSTQFLAGEIAGNSEDRFEQEQVNASNG
jgi:hypothetical protein